MVRPQDYDSANLLDSLVKNPTLLFPTSAGKTPQTDANAKRKHPPSNEVTISQQARLATERPRQNGRLM